MYLYANIVRVLRQGALNTFIDLNIQARVCPRVIKKSAQGCLHIQTLGDICSRLRKGEKLNFEGHLLQTQERREAQRMSAQGSNDEDSNTNMEVPQDNVPAQAAGGGNPEADPVQVEPGTAGAANLEDPRDRNTDADGQSSVAAKGPTDTDR